jgi:hypothetical protein
MEAPLESKILETSMRKFICTTLMMALNDHLGI